VPEKSLSHVYAFLEESGRRMSLETVSILSVTGQFSGELSSDTSNDLTISPIEWDFLPLLIVMSDVGSSSIVPRSPDVFLEYQPTRHKFNVSIVMKLIIVLSKSLCLLT